MAMLGIDLQEGFEGDEVVVKVNGEELFRSADVRTRRAAGLATHARFTVDDGPLSIEVSVPSRGIEKRIDVDARDRLFLGLSITGDDVRVIQRSQPFGYA
jgi:hypothetical protein